MKLGSDSCPSLDNDNIFIRAILLFNATRRRKQNSEPDKQKDIEVLQHKNRRP